MREPVLGLIIGFRKHGQGWRGQQQEKIRATFPLVITPFIASNMVPLMAAVLFG